MPKKILKLISASILLGLTTAAIAQPLSNPFQSTTSVQDEVNFLTGSLTFQGSGTFQTTPTKLPKSYYSNNINYWGNYVCASDNCAVKDVAYFTPYAIAPENSSSQGAGLQEERVFSTQASDIYDAATWQIAIALAASKKLSTQLSITQATQLINNENLRLNKIPSRASACTDYNPRNGHCSNNGFSYGYGKTATNIQNLQYAYAFRMLGPSYLVNDPFKNTGYASYVTDGSKVTTSQKGQVTWADWKPITGENAWAFLLGPIQSANLLAHGKPLSTANIGLNNALNFLWSLQRMQTPIGAFYYAMQGSAGNTGKAVPAGTISTENNASLLGGLTVLQKTIQNIPGWQHDPKLTAANNVINIMIYGGNLPQGGTTAGLVGYFKNNAWNKNENIFYQGGTYLNGTFKPTSIPFALDVNTWGILALGPKTIDSWWGPGTAYKIWEAARAKAGYFGPDHQLWGVGYTDQSAASAKKVLSGEWTAGAITSVHMLIQYYQHAKGINKDQLNSLTRDQESMSAGLLKLRSDQYKADDFKNHGGVLPKFLTKLPNNEKAIFYASARYKIPFGWYANPLPSAASTSWTIMLSEWYNPFGFQGSMSSPDFSTTPNYTKTNDKLYVVPLSLTILNELQNPKTHQYEIPITVSYSTKVDPNSWVELDAIANGSWGRIVIPNTAIKLSIAYQANNKWYSACQLSLTSDMLKTLQGNPLHTAMIASWVVPNGKGECKVI